jgi:rSAM/selenodomain-associated transferase 2
MASPPLSVVIPALNAEATLGAVLDALSSEPFPAGAPEVVVVDGGSGDGTCGLAAQRRARSHRAPRGRGPQLAAGAQAAMAPWLLFLHADTVLGAGWTTAVARYMERPESLQRAAYFRLVIDDASAAARRIERLANWRARRLGLPYGDQGLLIHRSFYEALGGYRPLPLMEDVDLVQRIGPDRLQSLTVEARTSAARYRRDGWWLRPARNLATLSLYFAGVPPQTVARLYR